MDTANLLTEIERTFSQIEMPSKAELIFHPDDCIECGYLREDLEQYRNKEITPDAIRSIHQEMPHLSAKAWRWIFPHYLRFCLTPEAEYSRMETEFLIYNLGPSLEFQEDTLLRLAALNQPQVDCLIQFLKWCLNQQYWRDYCQEDIERALKFLSEARD